jgi:hypothetical protein
LIKPNLPKTQQPEVAMDTPKGDSGANASESAGVYEAKYSEKLTGIG